MDLNRAFDRIPRTTFFVGGREVPAFRSLGIAGFVLALILVLLAGLRRGVPLATTAGMAATAGLSFFVWGLLRRALTGKEALVLIEYVAVAFVAVAGFLWASDVDAVRPLDAFAVALPVFLAFGRLGCLTVGCCHGQPASFGVVYGHDHELPDRLVDRRLFPLPLVEAVALVAIAVVGFGLVTATPGTATVWYLSSYAVVRFALEPFRGDRRPRLAGISVARLTCGIQFALALALAEAWLVPGGPGRDVAVAAAFLGTATIAGVVLDGVRRREALTEPDHLDEAWRTFVHLCAAPPSDQSAAGVTGPPASASTSQDLSIAVSRESEGIHVSMTHARWRAAPVVRLLFGDVVESRGVAHTWISRTDRTIDDEDRGDYFAPLIEG